MTREEAQVIIDDIRALWALAIPPVVIARQLHIPVRIIKRVIETGQFPQDDRQPQWQPPK